MTFEEVKEKLDSAKHFSITSVSDFEHGKRININNGCIVVCYNSGKVVYQGKNTDETKAFIENAIASNRKVFVVYGHDDIARTQLEAMLRRWDLEPIILDQVASGGKTIIEKLEEYSADVNYAIVLATPDDEGKCLTEDKMKKRVRQNVVQELGMFLSKLCRERVAILLKQVGEADEFEKPSDIQGLIYIPFQSNVEEAKVSLAKELARQNYRIDTKDL